MKLIEHNEKIAVYYVTKYINYTLYTYLANLLLYIFHNNCEKFFLFFSYFKIYLIRIIQPAFDSTPSFFLSWFKLCSSFLFKIMVES